MTGGGVTVNTVEPRPAVCFRGKVNIKVPGGVPVGLFDVSSLVIVSASCLGVAIETAIIGGDGDVHRRLEDVDPHFFRIRHESI